MGVIKLAVDISTPATSIVTTKTKKENLLSYAEKENVEPTYTNGRSHLLPHAPATAPGPDSVLSQPYCRPPRGLSERRDHQGEEESEEDRQLKKARTFTCDNFCAPLLSQAQEVLTGATSILHKHTEVVAAPPAGLRSSKSSQSLRHMSAHVSGCNIAHMPRQPIGENIIRRSSDSGGNNNINSSSKCVESYNKVDRQYILQQ
jgi:hypothetical protein